MSNYTITTNFGAKDSLPSGNAGKVIKGSEFTTEFTNIQTAIATKADIAGSDNISITRSSYVYLTLTGANPEIVLNDTSGTSNTCRIANGDGTLSYHADENNEQSQSRHRFYTDGTQRMEIEANGNVGIGTTSPLQALDVKKANDSQQITFGRTGSSVGHGTIGADATGAFGIWSSSDAKLVSVLQTGNVGIGTNSPNESLVVKGGTYAANQSGGMALQMGDTSGSHWQSSFKIKSDGSGNVRTAIDASTGAIGGQSQEVISINTAGNVGIGTDSPDQKLQVDGNIRLGDTATGVDDDEDYGLRTGGSLTLHANDSGNNTFNTALAFDVGNASGAQAASSKIQFRVNNTERMLIDSSGNVLVGTTDTIPHNNNSSGSTSDGIALSQDGFYSAARYGATCMVLNRMANDGSVLNFHNRGILEGYINTTQSGVSLVSTSDQRLKENITDSGDSGSAIDAIQVRQFDWIANGKHEDYGFVAQELANAVPDAVYTGEDEDETMGVDYSKLVPLLVKEVQALRSRVAQLEESE